MKEQEEAWVICPVCKTKLKKENISAHLKHVHDKKIEDVDESSIKVLPKKGQKQKPRVSKGVIAGIVVVLVVVVAMFFLFSGSSDNNGNHSNGPSWLDTYTPIHSLGTGSDDFWITYPSSNPSSGTEVDHFNWIVKDLKSKPVLFVVHITGCVGCADQAERVIEFGEEYEEYVKFYDLDAVDDAPADIIQKANEVYMYDPTGSPGYIALTGIYTYIEDNAEVKIGWHTWEAPNDMTVSNSDLEIWIKDAIYYHHINKGGI